jgi:hypothetical protein
METRWFIASERTGGLPEAIYKATFEGKTMVEEFVWSRKMQKWKPSTSIYGYLYNGSTEIDEVTEDFVKLYLPKDALTTDRDEVKTFIKFLSKSPTRPFEFVHVPEIYGEVLNKFVKAGDLDSARLYAERYLA